MYSICKTRSREENGSAQLYLLYLSLTAVGVVLLLAISLYCRYFCLQIHSQKIFMKLKHFPPSVRRRPEPAPAQYLVEGSCTLPRIDGIQGYTLPR